MWWAVQDSNRAALTTQVGRVSNQPSGLLLSPRFPTCRNVYQERCQTIRSEDFLFVVDGTGLEQHGTAAGGAIKAPVQRRRPLPAAETGRSCWGSVLIFQSPAKGLRKNQQTQPVAFVSPRFPTPRNVYQERCQTMRSAAFAQGSPLHFRQKYASIKKSDTALRRRKKVGAGCSGSRSWRIRKKHGKN